MSKSIYNEAYRDLVDAFKRARIDAGMTQWDVANVLQKPQSYVAKVEGYERRLDIIELFDLARTISWDPFPALQRLFGDGGDPQQDS
ncbi:hypothetical protein BXY66_0295 [Shimia isoporae]|uniref:Helix-turn-helix protein n=1 Tax=Shimia isoporae TaxID=647720 RepID=A0A4V2Q3S0_9RHOB|nr:helix-turn-helix transcriptional regulator [Shimia isoporae]TCL08260.1 hypothetical protein BXY66_0295 [Shimia isoporae]